MLVLGANNQRGSGIHRDHCHRSRSQVKVLDICMFSTASKKRQALRVSHSTLQSGQILVANCQEPFSQFILIRVRETSKSCLVRLYERYRLILIILT